MNKLVIFLLALLSSPFFIIAQPSEEGTSNLPENNLLSSEKLKEVNRLFEGNDYFGARQLLKGILKDDSVNYSASFKMGICLLNSFDNEEYAYIYFKRAITDMTDKYNFGDVEMKTAPFDALYFLGRSYMAINQPDSAIKYFKIYNDQFYGDPPIPVESKIVMCQNALTNKNAPRNVSIRNMGTNINSNFSEMYPIVTLDNSVVFFSSRRIREDKSNSELIDKRTGMYYSDIYYAARDGKGGWDKAQLFELNSDKNEAPVFIAPDGLTLYIRREKKGEGDFMQTVFKDGVWEKPSPLSSINSHFNETGLSITGDGQVMYFSSNRDGGSGQSDIYRAERKKNGKWRKPVNIGDVINTPFNEVSPFIQPNGKALFFSTDGNKLKGSGGFDVFYSELKEDGTWSEPQSMGYPINTTQDEFNYYITTGGVRYYNRAKKDRSFDLYKIEGGGFDAETLDSGIKVVTLTQELNVAEVLEVVEEVETEVEVIETIETEVFVESEVEVVDLEAMTEFEDEINSGSLLDEEEEPNEEVEAEVEEEEEPIEEPDELFTEMELEMMNEADRQALIEKVRSYLNQQVKSNNSDSDVLKSIRFNTNSYGLNLFPQEEQEALIALLQSSPDKKIKIIGYTDADGKTGSNFVLSDRRAKAIYEFLAKNGIDKGRMEYYGKGINNPVASNSTEDGKGKNRRAEVILVD